MAGITRHLSRTGEAKRNPSRDPANNLPRSGSLLWDDQYLSWGQRQNASSQLWLRRTAALMSPTME
jgi:hypothetical protein